MAQQQQDQRQQDQKRLPMNHRLPDLSWPASTLEPHMSGNTLELHYGKHHVGYGPGFRTFAMSSPHRPDQNHLLAALPAAEFERLAPHLELVPMPRGEILYEPDRQMRHAYFPTTAVVSLHHVMESGASAEAAGVGNEGFVGISLFMGGDTMSSSAAVRTAGHAYRLAGRLLKQEFSHVGVMQRLLLRYTQALIAQIIQTAACNRHHTIDQQLCRWLLSALDRAPSGEVIMTHELVASMLGVRREGISEVARKLQRAGFIRYSRGHIAVLERSGLETRTCECYAAVKKELSRLVSDVRNCEVPLSCDNRLWPATAPGAATSISSAPATLTNWRLYSAAGRRPAAMHDASVQSVRSSQG